MAGSRPGALTVPVASLAVALTIACGGGSNGGPTSPSATPPPATPSGGTLTFKADGVSESATSITASFANGILSIGGTDSSRATTLSFALTPTAAGTGTYSLGPLSTANALVLIGNPAAGWQAAAGIGNGTITINSLTSTTASGTFSFSLVAVAGSGASGTKSITEGAFNVTFTSVPSPAPTPSGGSTISALVDGVQWTSSLTRRATLGNNFLTLTGQDTNFRVITIVVPVSSTLFVPPSQPPTILLNGTLGLVTMVLGAQNWDNGHAGGGGTFTLTGLSVTRVTGTFTATLVLSGSNASPGSFAQLTSGQFDMALERF
ncbi:MAG TPA: DUF6252 family protein [Vicinamibacterales bacterium]|nr:DUF6252 family protein [Vicinamibacterales bacterium]